MCAEGLCRSGYKVGKATRRLMALWCMTHFPPFPQTKKKKKKKKSGEGWRRNGVFTEGLAL